MASSDSYIGSIALVGFNFTMAGWAQADGSLISIDQNEALYSLFGTLYGGNASLSQGNFGLPKLTAPTASNDTEPTGDTTTNYQVSLNGVYPDRS